MDLFEGTILPDVVPGRRLTGQVAELRIGDGPGFGTRIVETLAFSFEGIVGDGHAGFTRAAGGREPWYPRGTEIRSGRQISAVSADELAVVAATLSIAEVDAGAIGANIVVAGVPRFSFLPAGTLIAFESGAALVVEAQNGPCRHAGKALAALHPGRDDIELAFVAAAKRRRGVVLSVERPGAVKAGGTVSIRVPEQWIYA